MPKVIRKDLELRKDKSIESSRNILTPRWFTIPEHVRKHSIQKGLESDLMNRKYYHYTICAGRRSFKTERFGKRYLVNQAITNTNGKFFAGAPVRKQAKEIFWKDLKALSPSYLVKSINETDLKIVYTSESEINVVGLKEFATIEGGFAHGFLISEYQKCDPAVYDQAIEPMVNDVGGWVIKEGRPLGKNHFYDDYVSGLDRKPGYSSYFWTSEEILTPLQIERAKSSLGQIDYSREYLASFETGGNPPYYSFHSTLSNSEYQLQQGLPVVIACDFNATDKPMSWVLGQRLSEHGQDVTHWVKAFSHTFTNTSTMCDIVGEYLKELNWTSYSLIFYGDYSGKSPTSNSSKSDWEIIESKFKNFGKFEKRIKPCRSIRDTIAATNAQLCNVLGQRRQFVNIANCEALVKDWEGCEWKDNGTELKDNNDLRGHSCRAVDYYNDFEHPITTSGKVQTIRNFNA